MTKYLLITRHPADCAGLQKLLAPHGWGVRPYPVLRVENVDDTEGWREAHSLFEDWGASLWLVFASPRAPDRFAHQATERGLDAMLSLPIAAIGDATAGAAARAGMHVQLVGPGTAMGLAKELMSYLDPQSPVVYVSGRDRRPDLVDALEAAGNRVHPLVVYQMRPTPPRELPPLGPDLAAVALTSPRSAQLYLESVGGKPLPLPHWAIGPTTQYEAAGLGIVCQIPLKPTLESLAEELCRT